MVKIGNLRRILGGKGVFPNFNDSFKIRMFFI